jgi:protein-L-isoaspartate(D-aspartate) O-methyltransferase
VPPEHPRWVEKHLRRRGIHDPRVLDAMSAVPRELFVPPAAVGHAYDDAALPIGHGQTISQPFIVALICEALGLDGTERVLDVGTGSGYQAAVLAELAGEVVSIERIPELAERARANLERAGYAGRVDLRGGDGTLGVADRAPYGGIAVAAAATELPDPLWEQLAEGARLVLPLGTTAAQDLVVLERSGDTALLRGTTPVRFVSLVSGAPSP